MRGKAFRDRLSELAEILDFGDLLGRTVGKLSGGQRRRVDIARALIHRPEILILDEPTTGLDPQTRKLLWDVVTGLRRQNNMTVFLTTHYMEEAADADYVVILDNGEIAAEGTPLQLKNTYTGDFITLYNTPKEQVERLKPCMKPSATRCGSPPDTRAATQLILAHPEIFTDYEIAKGKMDDVFLAVTGKRLSAAMPRRTEEGIGMTGLFSLVKRDCKLFFKDKGMFFTSLITPMILLVLYATFLAKAYKDGSAPRYRRAFKLMKPS